VDQHRDVSARYLVFSPEADCSLSANQRHRDDRTLVTSISTKFFHSYRPRDGPVKAPQRACARSSRRWHRA
jgi:hypothetical protein